MSYDKKYRERVLAYVDVGKKAEEVRKMLGFGANTITNWKKLRKETGPLENRELKRSSWKIDSKKLAEDVKAYPDDFSAERAVRFGCSESGIDKALKRAKITRKKECEVQRTR